MPENSDNEFEKTVRMHRPGDRLFDRYVLKKRLGQGGMGIVWQALDERLDIDVALKVLPDSLRTNEGALSQLKHEAQKCVKLTHSRIVRMFDFLVTEELAALSMEFVDGKTLAQLRAEKPDKTFKVWEIREWVRQICEALSYAHSEARIVHRDLKPSNVMIGADGNVKVADFGISRSLEGTMTGPIMGEMATGTLAYMGPQQLSGDSPSIQDDIYSLGAMIYECLTSKPPFYDGDVFSQIELTKPDTPTARREKLGVMGEAIPEEWESVILKCLAKRDSDRPKSLREALEGLGLSSEEIEEEPKKENWIPWLVGGFVVVATLFFGFSSLVDSGSDEGGADPVGLVIPPPEPPDGSEGPEEPVGPVEPMAAFTNSLGMEFVGIPGLNVGFAKYETTVGLFRLFVEETGHDADKGMYRQITTPEELQAHWEETRRPTNSVNLNRFPPSYLQLGGWRNPGYEQTDNHPIAGMSLNDALEFCRWLTGKERVLEKITEAHEYTLPSDYEWSIAAGMADERKDLLPQERHELALEPNSELSQIFPWGKWTDDAPARGNYWSDSDPYEMAAPVGQFPPTEHGLYDLGGNVSEWCRDSYDQRREFGALRGNSWYGMAEKAEETEEAELMSAWRNKPVNSKPHKRNATFGFRCVLRPTGK